MYLHWSKRCELKDRTGIGAKLNPCLRWLQPLRIKAVLNGIALLLHERGVSPHCWASRMWWTLHNWHTYTERLTYTHTQKGLNAYIYEHTYYIFVQRGGGLVSQYETALQKRNQEPILKCRHNLVVPYRTCQHKSWQRNPTWNRYCTGNWQSRHCLGVVRGSDFHL